MTEQTTQQTNALALLKDKSIAVINKNRSLAEQVNKISLLVRDLETGLDNYENDLIYAAVLKELRESITPDQIELLSSLQNTGLGFKTDKPSTGYDPSTLKNIFVEAISIGVRIRGNEFNILAGNLYVTKTGLIRLVDDCLEKNNYKVFGRDNPKIELTSTGNYKFTYDGVVKNAAGEVVVDYSGPYKKEILVKGKVGRGDKQYDIGHDAAQGKAQRKFENYLYSKLNRRKNLLPEGSVEDVDMPSSPQKEKISITQLTETENEQE